MRGHPTALDDRLCSARDCEPSGHCPRKKETRVSDLVAIAYPDVATARQVTSNLGQAQKAHLIELDDVAIVEHRQDGKIKLHQPSLTGVGAASGALWGGLIGLLFLVPFLGMAIGAASGAAAGAMSDAGVDDKFMKNLGARLEPGAAAVIALVREANMEKVLANVKIQGEVIQTSLSEDTEQALKDALAAAGK
jgi:uncharacterized membrane protein